MANTKKLSREERKAKKRQVRRELKKLYKGLPKKQRREFVGSGKSLKAYLAEKKKAAEKPAAAS